MPDVDAAVAFWNENGTPKLTQRTPGAVSRFFEGLELLDPGVVSCNRWRPEDGPASCRRWRCSEGWGGSREAG